MNEETEKVLQDLGVTELLEKKQAELGIAQTTPPAEVQTPIATETPTTTPETPVVEVKTEKAETTPKEVDIWGEIIQPKEPVETDWKVEAEKAKTEYQALQERINKSKIVKNLLEVESAPDYDLEKFLENIVPKKIDFTKQPLEALYKESLFQDSVEKYSDDEIEQLWEAKKAEIEENPLLAKTLRSALVKELQEKQPQEAEESELIKEWKESAKAKREAEIAAINEQREVVKGISDFSKSLIGKKIAGEIEITPTHVEGITEKMDANYYRGKDGKLDSQRLAQDRLKAVMFDEVVKYYTTKNKIEATIEARKEITRPNANESGGGQVISTDARDNATKIIEETMEAMGLGESKNFVLKNNPK